MVEDLGRWGGCGCGDVCLSVVRAEVGGLGGLIGVGMGGRGI